MEFWHFAVILAIIGIAVFFISQNSGPITGFSVLELSGNSPSFGPSDAKVVIVEFSDYQCPACLTLEKSFKEVLPEFSGKYRLIYRNFPLFSIHPQAITCAEAALSAGEQGKFWEMHAKLFENQAQISKEGIVAINKIAKEIGLDEAKFSESLSSRKFAPAVKNDLDDGSKFGIDGTPTFFINGKKYVGAYSSAELKKIIADALAK